MSRHTILAYTLDLEQFGKYLASESETSIDPLSLNSVRGWMSEMIQKGIATRTVHRKVSSLRALYGYMRKQGVIDIDPLARLVLPKVPKKIVLDIPVNDLTNMFRNFPWQEHKHGDRDKLVILLLYTTGMRLSELIGMKTVDVDLKRQSILVTGKRNKQRLVPIHPELGEAITTYCSTRKQKYLISSDSGEMAYPMMIYRIVTQYLKLFSSALKTSPHVLRHSFATHMLNNGANLMAIKELLGHSSLTATQVYTKNSFEKLKAIHKLHPRN